MTKGARCPAPVFEDTEATALPKVSNLCLRRASSSMVCLSRCQRTPSARLHDVAVFRVLRK